jgi:hypothetical protein
VPPVVTQYQDPRPFFGLPVEQVVREFAEFGASQNAGNEVEAFWVPGNLCRHPLEFLIETIR